MRVLLYDADCGFCTRAARWLERRGSDFAMVPWQDFDLDSVGVSPDAAAARIHAVDDSTIVTGHHAIAAVLATCRSRTLRAAGRLSTVPVVSPLAARVYDVVAAHRHRLPGGTPACRLPQEDS